MAAEALTELKRARRAVDPMARLARAEGYTLLGELLLDGARPELIARAQQVAPFATRLLGDDLDDLAAEHHRLFEREVFPYASVFLAPGSQTGGTVATLAQEAAAHGGVERASLDVSDDHLGALLVLLGRLAHAELDAEAMANDRRATACRTWSLRVLDDGLLSWLPVLRAALAYEDESVWTDVVAVAHELARAHRDELGGRAPAPLLPAVPAILDDEATRLRDLARFTLTPCWAGVFLSGATVMTVARGVELPTGFGSREQRLAGLLQSAADYGDPPAVLRALAHAVDRSRAALDALRGGIDEETVRVFSQRAGETSELLLRAAEMADAVRG